VLFLQLGKLPDFKILADVLAEGHAMDIAMFLLLLVWVSLMLAWGVLNLIENLTDESPHAEPTFREPGPMFHDQHALQRGAKSRFAWQSRSRWQAPD
jgi:hypothetical protein